MSKRKGRVLAGLLALMLVCTSSGMSALADETGEPSGKERTESGSEGLCEHHPAHTDECGFDEEAGTPCTYVCDICGSEDTSEITGTDSTTDEEDTTVTEDASGTDETGIKETGKNEPSSEQTNSGSQPAENTDEEENTVQITGWNWIDEDGVLQNTENVWGLGVPGVSEENPLTQDALLEMLPKEVELTLSDGSEKTAALTWDLSAIPEEGIWSGDVTVTATVDGTYSFAEGAAPIEVKVELGGAETYASKPHLDANKVEGETPQGTTINVFDYWLNDQDASDRENPDNYQNIGINGGEVLKFGTGMGTNANVSLDNLNHVTVNDWTDGKEVRQGIVEKKLGDDGYPVLNQNKLGGDSLSYLFDPEEEHDGKASYPDAAGLLQVDDTDGYFYYDSQKNFAELNKDTREFTLYNTWAVYAGGSSPRGQFFPFNTGAQVFDDEWDDNGINQKDLNSISGVESVQNNNDQFSFAGVEINHYFGLSMTSRFVQRYGGHTEESGSKVTYEFSGDDDVWVFIDDVLVADLGGIHDMASLAIDFSDGSISINGSPDGTLKSKFEAAGKESSTTWSRNTFADDTYHTLKFFYLERGNTDSNMSLKFNLVTVPESGIIKVDQAGNHIAGAEFALYEANADYTLKNNPPICTGTTDDEGELIFVDEQGMLISLAELYGDGIRYMVLRETQTPRGYRSAGDMHLRFERPNDTDVVLLSSNEWDTGSYSSAKVTAQTGEEIHAAQGKQSANLDHGGTLFAVVLQRKDMSVPVDNTDNWRAVSGDPENGWFVSDHSDVLEGVIAAAQANPYEFGITASGAYETTVENVPGDITKYYYMLSGNARDDAEYTIGYYYTSAPSVAGATISNTWRVDSDDFQRLFSADLYVANVQNNLYVQKLDEKGNAVSVGDDGQGSADFALYEKEVIDKAADITINEKDGTYEGDISRLQTVQTVSTSNMQMPLVLDGGAMFTQIPAGAYYLIETKAPSGYDENRTLIPVIVDNTGVYVNAGTANDGVSVRRGVGSIVHSMLQFAAGDDIDATLHNIKATLVTAGNGTYGRHTIGTWTKQPNEERHLQFKEGSEVLNYLAESGKDEDRYFELAEGWSKLEIHQCLEHAADSPKQDLEEEGDPNLVNLYSGTVVARVQNQRVGNLEISKSVKAAEGEKLPENAENAEFTFTLALTDADGTALTEIYTGTIYEGDQATPQTVSSTDETITLKHGQTVRFENLPYETHYSVEETDIPTGYTPSVTVDTEAAVTDNNKVEGAVPHNDTERVAYTNTYSNTVTLTGDTAIIGQKTLKGKAFTEADSFSFTMKLVNEQGIETENPNVVFAENAKTVTVNGGGSSGGVKGFSFENVTFKAPGTYYFAVEETIPDPGIANMSYDTHTAKVTVVIGTGDDGKLERTSIAYDNSSSEIADDKEIDNKAAFTNQLTSSFSFKKINKENQLLPDAVFALYELQCTDNHDHSKDLIEVEETGDLSASYQYKDCWKLVKTATSANDGQVTFEDLPVGGEYRLVEIKAPAGYTLPKGQWKVTYDGTKFTIKEEAAVGNPPAYNGTDGTIINYRPGELPFSGNIGIRLFLLLGGALMVFGAAGGTWWYMHNRQTAAAGRRSRRRRR